MKKLILLGLMVLLVGVLALPALAAENDADFKAWVTKKFEAKQQFIDQAVKDGRITAEQGEVAGERLQERYKAMEENNFQCPNGREPGDRFMGGKGAGKDSPGCGMGGPGAKGMMNGRGGGMTGGGPCMNLDGTGNSFQ